MRLRQWLGAFWRRVSSGAGTPVHPRGLAKDCGPELTPLFQRLLDGLGDVEHTDFSAAARMYFDGASPPDPFFDNLARLALPFPDSRIYEGRILDIGLQVAHEWEASSGKRIHKGSGYYFAGMRDIILGDLDRGFLFMHQALVEDQRSGSSATPDTPALAFVTMNAAKMDQAFRQEVTRYADLVEGRLHAYRTAGRGTLTFDQLRAKAIARPSLLESLFSLVFAVARIVRLEQPAVAFTRDNQFADLLFGQIGFDLCLIIDQFLAEAFPRGGYFLDLATAYTTSATLGISRPDLREANTGFGGDFRRTMADLLDGGYRLVGGATPNDLASDLMVAYGVRNRMAHGLTNEAIIEDRFEAIEHRLFFVIFSIAERLFP
jgi:hypothetical protein